MEACGGLVDVVDDDGVALELNLVILAPRALDVAAAVGVRVVRLFNALCRSLQGGFGLDQPFRGCAAFDY